MFESVITYNRRSNFKEDEYWPVVKEIMEALVKDPMVLEFRAFKNLMGSPHTKMSIYWAEATHWAKFASSDKWTIIEKQLQTMVTDIKIELWAPSEYLPDPVVTHLAKDGSITLK